MHEICTAILYCKIEQLLCFLVAYITRKKKPINLIKVLECNFILYRGLKYLKIHTLVIQVLLGYYSNSNSTLQIPILLSSKEDESKDKYLFHNFLLNQGNWFMKKILTWKNLALLMFSATYVSFTFLFTFLFSA